MKQPATFFVRPAPGRRVRDPLTLQVLPEVGEMKPRNSYWERRLKDEDVIEGPLTSAAPQPTMKRHRPEASPSESKE